MAYREILLSAFVLPSLMAPQPHFGIVPDFCFESTGKFFGDFHFCGLLREFLYQNKLNFVIPSPQFFVGWKYQWLICFFCYPFGARKKPGFAVEKHREVGLGAGPRPLVADNVAGRNDVFLLHAVQRFITAVGLYAQHAEPAADFMY